jgi:hypothetical protein
MVTIITEGIPSIPACNSDSNVEEPQKTKQ